MAPRCPVALCTVRIARFVHPGSAAVPGGVAWGTVEGPPGAELDALTVAAIDGHPFGPITFTGDRWALPDVRLLSPILPSKVVAVGHELRRARQGDGRRGPGQPGHLPQAVDVGDRRRRHDPAAARLQPRRPRGRAGHRHRPPGPRRRPAPTRMAHILGYTAANDVTARDQQRADGQFTRPRATTRSARSARGSRPCSIRPTCGSPPASTASCARTAAPAR